MNVTDILDHLIDTDWVKDENVSEEPNLIVRYFLKLEDKIDKDIFIAIFFDLEKDSLRIQVSYRTMDIFGFPEIKIDKLLFKDFQKSVLETKDFGSVSILNQIIDMIKQVIINLKILISATKF